MLLAVESFSHVQLFCDPWTVGHLFMGFASKNTGMDSPFLLQRIFLTRGSNLRLLYWQAIYLLVSHLGSPLVAESFRNGAFFFSLFPSCSK